MFLAREEELQILNNDYLLPSSSFNMLFGRKKVGKTTLLNKYLKDKRFIYISFVEITPSLLYKKLQEKIEKFLDKSIKPISSCEDFFYSLTNIEENEKIVIVLDDFQNLVKVDKESLSQFYKIWNKSLSSQNLQIIVSTSLKSSNADDEYIYKKATNQIRLKSFGFNHLKDLLPNVDKNDLIFIYSSFGTNTQYLNEYDSKKDFLLNVKENFLSSDKFLFQEGMNILKNDLTEIGTYSSILYAMAMGNNKIGEIASFLDVKSTYLTRYIQKLIDLMIIEKDVPLNDDIRKSKFGRYDIEDNFLRFWFCYIYPNISLINRLDTYTVINEIRNDFSNRLVKLTYKEHIFHLISSDPYKFLGFIPKKIGRWWNNKEATIDLIAYDSKDIVFCDTIWKQNEKLEISYSKLKAKSESFKTSLNKKYIIFSKNSKKAQQ